MYHQLQPIKKLIIPFKVDALLPNVLILIPRAITGYLLSFVFAINKFGTPWTPASVGLAYFEVSDWFVALVTQFGIPFSFMPELFAWSAGLTEALGGILLILGLNTRMTAFFITVTMFTTIVCRPWDGSWNIMPTFIFFCLGLFFMGFGSGKFGLDYLITKRI
ncbi:DoxX family membrane protein [Maribacter sp. 1_MG-2023]|uniref:DoxX family membrane protein n=1 Tax=Maribacter sp. 1_MG-2023 TaxID=3062677 RepID=UPI0026E3682F|nr:DoxX family membrane protein [Maribacter sp. 1_MG-2023]MDO6472347.1 DoxX family membrane protein [Maribacter sp. 1_MG-2023]